MSPAKVEQLVGNVRIKAVADRKSIDQGDVMRLGLVMFLWALCFPLITVGLAFAPPLALAALRSFMAGAGLLLPAIVLRRAWPRGWRVWLLLLGTGLTITSMGFGGMFLAGGLVSPGLATVLANVQPLIAAVLGFFLLGERLGPRRRVGLSLGFAGILLVALPGFNVNGANSSPVGIGFIMLGAVGVAAGNVLLKKLAGQVDLLMATGLQFILGGAPLLALAWMWESPDQVVWNGPFVAVLLALGLLGTAVPFALWFSLLHHSELNRLNTATFLTPAFALILGVLFFSESLRWVEMLGIAFILAGVLWANRRSNMKTLPEAAKGPAFGERDRLACSCCTAAG